MRVTRALLVLILIGMLTSVGWANNGTIGDDGEPSPFLTNSKPTLSVLLVDPDIWAQLVNDLSLTVIEQAQLQAIINDEMIALGQLKQALDMIARDSRLNQSDKREQYLAMAFNQSVASVNSKK